MDNWQIPRFQGETEDEYLARVDEMARETVAPYEWVLIDPLAPWPTWLIRTMIGAACLGALVFWVALILAINAPPPA